MNQYLEKSNKSIILLESLIGKTPNIKRQKLHHEKEDVDRDKAITKEISILKHWINVFTLFEIKNRNDEYKTLVNSGKNPQRLQEIQKETNIFTKQVASMRELLQSIYNR